METKAMFDTVRDYVLKERARLKIEKVDTSVKPEPSGEAFGEFNLLLDRQLLTTTEGFGGWNELQDAEILEGVYRVVQKRNASES